HLDGTISMARFTPDSAVSDFFICINDQPALDFGGMRNPDGQGFAAFGRVIEGMDIVRRIHGQPADGQSLNPPITISRIVIEDNWRRPERPRTPAPCGRVYGSSRRRVVQ